MSSCAPHAHRCPWRPEDVGSPGIGVPGGCELLDRVNLGPLREQWVLSTTESSLQTPPTPCLIISYQVFLQCGIRRNHWVWWTTPQKHSGPVSLPSPTSTAAAFLTLASIQFT